MDENIKEIEKYAKKEDVPIMQKRGINFLCNLIKKNNIKNILEIGTAIGYSSIMMSLVDDDIRITTIERDESRYLEAIKNIKKCNKEKQITLILGDALETTIEGEYDLIFIDAAKAQYINYLPEALRLLNNGGIMLADNCLQGGDILESKFIVERRDRTIHKRMREFLYAVENDDRLTTTILTIGDGVALSVKNEK